MDGELTNGSARTGALRIDGTQDGAQGDCAQDGGARDAATSAPIVEVRNLVKRYGDVVALDHFDLRIEPGRDPSGFWARTARARRRPSIAYCSCSPSTRATSACSASP